MPKRTVNCRQKEVQKLVGTGMARVQNGIVACSLMGDVATSSHGTITSMNADANADQFRIIEVRSGVDPAVHIAKLSEVHAIMAADLGTESLEAEDARSLLWIRNRRILGCIVVQETTEAFLELPSIDEIVDQSPKSVAASPGAFDRESNAPKYDKSNQLSTASEEPAIDVASPAIPGCTDGGGGSNSSEGSSNDDDDDDAEPVAGSVVTGLAPVTPASRQSRVLLGVRAIWVHRSVRRCGVATTLLDAARNNLCFDAVVPRAACAFTSPTAAGRAFALRYCGTGSSMFSRDLPTTTTGRHNAHWLAFQLTRTKLTTHQIY